VVIDSSRIVATLNEESGGPDPLRPITNEKPRLMGAPTAVETAMMLRYR
jgi:uncharacterized protein with PIN domain